jgi:hypothetical protein
VTEYGRILLDERAHAALRTHDDLEVAKGIVRRQSLADRIARVAIEIDLLMEEIYQIDTLVEDDRRHDLLREIERLFGATRTLRSTIRDLAGDD